MKWNPDTYHKFQSQRFAPFEDLVKLIDVREDLGVIDLGCGTGELTKKLFDYLPNPDILGIDKSPHMLERAKDLECPGLRFEENSIENISGKWDLIFSNAALQWVEDHPGLIEKLFSLLSPGGQFVVQIPANHNHPTQRLIVEVSGQEPFKSALGGWNREWWVLSIREYSELIFQNGGQDITVFEKVYPHVLGDVDAVADWLCGTALLPYFERLPEDLHESFLAAYKEKLGKIYTETPVFYPFRRIFFSAKTAK